MAHIIFPINGTCSRCGHSKAKAEMLMGGGFHFICDWCGEEIAKSLVEHDYDPAARWPRPVLHTGPILQHAPIPAQLPDMSEFVPLIPASAMDDTCPECKGKGSIILLVNSVPCKPCAGTGKQQKFKTATEFAMSQPYTEEYRKYVKAK